MSETTFSSKKEAVASVTARMDLERVTYKGNVAWAISKMGRLWCLVLTKERGSWRAVPIPEEAQPPHYSCPENFLKLTEPASLEWRREVKLRNKRMKRDDIARIGEKFYYCTAASTDLKLAGPDKIDTETFTRADIDEVFPAGEWVPVDSSNLKAVRVKNSTLDIQFKNETIYRYSQVPLVVSMELLSADSVGKAFYKLIRSGGYAYEQLV